MKDIQTVKNSLLRIIKELPGKVLRESEENMRMKPLANKWSKLEILGHLVDSALNNHQRWIRILQGEPLTINYNQDKWVLSQHYQTAPAQDVLNLWILLNKQLCRILERMEPGDLNLKYHTGETEITLGYLVEDYLNHLNHHIPQIVKSDVS